jgi:ribonuclease BN (tRNA processing enzyme)
LRITVLGRSPSWQDAEVGRLVITHFSDEMDELWARREAERTFAGPVSVAREGSVYDV